MQGPNWERLDQFVYDRLTALVDVLPMRLVKMVANYYTDARVRKLYWRRLGIEMGEGTYANLGLALIAGSAAPTVHIGRNVSIGPGVTFITKAAANNGQEINTLPYVREHLTTEGDITVEDEVWFGANVTVLPGVRIGRCTVIGAGSVVTKDLEPYSVYVGAPARRIRDLCTGERVNKKDRG